MISKPYQGKPLRDTFPKLQRFLHFRMPLTPVDDFAFGRSFCGIASYRHGRDGRS